MIHVIKIDNMVDLEEALAIRREVFVVEQQCPEEEEYLDDEVSIHYLAIVDEAAAGTARWRVTEKGVKLERFAVLQEYRKRGVASALLETILDELILQQQKNIYLHAQVPAMPLYEKFGFEREGELFYEANIPHYKMVYVKRR
jgi:predicted GNAT family N-acyltransferase